MLLSFPPFSPQLLLAFSPTLFSGPRADPSGLQQACPCLLGPCWFEPVVGGTSRPEGWRRAGASMPLVLCSPDHGRVCPSLWKTKAPVGHLSPPSITLSGFRDVLSPFSYSEFLVEKLPCWCFIILCDFPLLCHIFLMCPSVSSPQLRPSSVSVSAGVLTDVVFLAYSFFFSRPLKVGFYQYFIFHLSNSTESHKLWLFLSQSYNYHG